jgi:hypothetical protein
MPELRMRRFLGLQGAAPLQPSQLRSDQARPRHRFVQDGEVPVVIANSPRAANAAANGAAMQAALDHERAARTSAERLLAEAQATIQSLRTKLAHAEMAQADALAAERHARERAEAALREAVAAREQTEQKPSKTTARTRTAPEPHTSSAKPASKTPAAKKGEPQPVKWWLPGHRAGAQG